MFDLNENPILFALFAELLEKAQQVNKQARV